MKSIVATGTLLLAFFISSAQTDSLNLPPYKKFPIVPPFKILKTDSAGYFTKNDLPKNKALLLITFSPECEHCQHETEEILDHIDSFKNIEIVMATTMPFHMMKEFYEHYNLANYDNIVVGQDFQYILPSFFRMRNLPYLAMYDKKGKLLTTFEGTMPVDELLNVFK